MSQHAIPQIAQIGCARAEIRIFGHIVRRNFRIDRRAPGLIGGTAGLDPCERRCDKTVVFQQRNLESENGFRFIIARLVRERAKIFLRRRERLEESLAPLCRRPILTNSMLDGSQTHERTQRDSGGGGPSLDAKHSPVRSIVHPENPRRPASPALPARLSRQSLPRENRSSCPLAPWSPSP